MGRIPAAVLVAGLAAVPAAAGELVVGLGVDDVFDRNGGPAAALSLQVGTEPRFALGPVGLGFGAAIDGDADGDLWAGGGVIARMPFGRGFRGELSVMAGGYAVGDGGSDLGHDLQFRSRIGVSRAVAERWRLGLALEHKSNAGLSEINPGVETLYLTLTRGF